MHDDVLIIAEAGVNHDGNIEKALKLVDAAAEAGANVVKFQTFSADRLATKKAEKADYQKQNSPVNETQYEMLKRLELSQRDHEILINHCIKHDLEFLSSAFDLESLSFLLSQNLNRLKVPSGEITNLPYLEEIGKSGKKIILSTGMANLKEIADALEIFIENGAQKADITVLHCNTDYPTNIRDVNLSAMSNMAHSFGVKVGYSDHTIGSLVPVAAVALGAVVIEKHLTLDRSADGPDHSSSMEPQEFAEMVESIRQVSLALGDGIKRPTESELKNIHIVRKSIVAAKPINKGEILTLENLCVKRPGSGLSPMRMADVIGQRAKKCFKQNELIEL